MNRLIRGTAGNNQIRFMASVTTGLVGEAAKRHMTSPVVSAALGRLLTAGILMATTMKNDKDILTLQIKCDGPIKNLLVIADSKGNVKGYPGVNIVDIPLKSNGKLDVSAAIGSGMLNVVKDIGLKEAYTGQTELISGEIAEDLTYYYYHSEQTPSIIALGVLVDTDYTIKHSGGIMIQLLPSAEESIVLALENNMKDVKSVTELLDAGLGLEGVIEHYLKGIDFKVMDEIEPRFYCDCTEEKVKRVMISLGKDELSSMINDEEKVSISCNFCNSTYEYNLEDLQEIVNRL
ncbi:MAG: Hsp33 family molecular chaperone HslO [Vallitaleaceae bacterium]|jgi:molecular chaperone Hsp33|nr:Hsp33 family molecular chaperone HslO [Vallitaleaceae bacterium]